MTNFQVWSGLETIGGNIVEITTETARVLCDFGLTGGSNKDVPQANLSLLETTLLEGKLPQIPGVFDTEGFQTVTLDGIEGKYPHQAIFISHLHIDHMGGLKFLPANTDVYMTNDSLRLYQALIQVGDEVAPQAKLIGLDYGQTVAIGDIKVTMQASDHDIVGIAGIFIETPDAKFVHSGDFRITGYHEDQVQNLINAINAFAPNYVFIEGTAFSFDVEEDRINSEADLLDIFEKCLHEYADELIAVNPYLRNIERMHHLVQVAEAAGRHFVFEPAYAHVYGQFYKNEKLYILVDQNKDEDLEQYCTDTMQTLAISEIIENPENYIIQNSFDYLEQLRTLKPAVYLHSNGEPIGAYMPTYATLIAFLEELDIPYIPFGVSGHASKDDLLRVAVQIKSDKIVPWHTFHPDNYGKILTNLGLKVFHPEYGKSYKV
ncbi:MBL fold metallo-hydrolase [Aerococcus agrisoli]|nr:MBL fold metallo-hydrolase [Aerococcus agrisoli]